jgi:hypothetical protein
MRRLRWRRWWAAEGLPALRLLAIEHWDPLGVYDDPERATEYDPYLERVGRMLRTGKRPDQIAHYLGRVRTEALKRGESEDADSEFVDRVVTWYALSAPDA